jgi:hypothetical protein
LSGSLGAEKSAKALTTNAGGRPGEDRGLQAVRW